MPVLGHRLAIEEGIMLSRTQVERLQLLLRDGDFTGDGKLVSLPEACLVSVCYESSPSPLLCSDYEMLRALDDDVVCPSHGLSKTELDLLPIHIYKGGR